MSRSLAGVCILLLSVPTGGHGQERAGPQEARGSESSDVISASYQRPLSKPHDDRYTKVIVHYCEAQAERISDSVVWGWRSDTIPWGPYDTLPTEVRRRARECSSQINIQGVGRIFFEAAGKLALVAGNDSLLPPILDSLIIMERESREAGVNGYPGPGGRFFRVLLSAAPARVDLARRMLAQNNLLNGSAYPEGNGKQLLMYNRTEFYTIFHQFGINTANVKLIEESRDSIRSIFSAFDKAYPDSLNDFARIGNELTYLRMTRYIYAYQFGADSILENVERQVALGLRAFPGGAEREVRGLLGLILSGMPAPSMDAPFSFLRDGMTKIHEPGRSMVVVTVGENCDATCAAEIMRFKRLIGNVPLVLIAEVYGNVRRSNPGTSAENAEALRAHLQDSLGINLSLVVDTAPRYVTPAPDLKYLYGQSRLRLRWANAGTASVFKPDPRRVYVNGIFLIGPRGKVVWESSFDSAQRDNKELLAYVIRKIAGSNQ